MNVRSLGVDYYIISNGAAIYQSNGAGGGNGNGSNADFTRVYENLVPYEIWTAAAAVFDKAGSTYEVYCDGESYMNAPLLADYDTPALSKEFIAELKHTIKPVENVASALRDRSIEKISVLSTPGDAADRLARDLAKISDITLCSSIPGNVELTFAPTSKGYALAHLCKKLGITADNILAFGDSGNDIEMLKFSKYGYAMENADAEVRAVTNLIAPRYDRDGVAAVINRVCFGE